MNAETLRKAYELRSLESRAVTAVAPVLPTLPLYAARSDAVPAKAAWITHNITGMHNRAPDWGVRSSRPPLRTHKSCFARSDDIDVRRFKLRRNAEPKWETEET